MRRLILILIPLGILFTSSASAQVNFGLTTGLNFASQVVKGGGAVLVSNSRTSPFLGGLVEKNLSGDWNLESGLIFSNKGSKFLEDGDVDLIKLSYLEIPIKVKYKYDVGNLILYGTSGFYTGFAIGGKNKFTESDGTVTNGDIKIGGTQNDDIKGLDLGFGIGAGVQLEASGKPLQIGFSYDGSLTNLSPDAGTTLKNRVFSLRLSYFLSPLSTGNKASKSKRSSGDGDEL